jgi:3-oxoadipate enol-lactonase
VPTASVNGISVYYERAGDGPPLLFLNGSGATLETVRLLISPFTAHLDVVAHDQRGLGRTEVPTPPYSMADYAADALALLDHVGWERCRVVGISFGGMVAQELAVTAPERVERLALLCTSPGGEGGSSYPLHDLAGLDAAERRRLGARLLDTRFDDDWLAAHPDDRALVALFAERRVETDSEAAATGPLAQLEARRHHDVWDRLTSVTCPTLVACGRFDGIAPLPNSEAIAARIPSAELRIYDGGHAFFAQDSRALPEVVDFLSA